MTQNERTHYAGLIFSDDSDLTAKTLLSSARHAMTHFGARDLDVGELTYDSLVLESPDATLEIQFVDAPEVDVFANPADAPTETFVVEITLHDNGTLPGAHARTGEALLATILQSYIELTGAPMIQWQSRETVLSARRFQTAMTPIRRETDAPKAETKAEADVKIAAPVAKPRRVQPTTTHRARCGTVLEGGMSAMAQRPAIRPAVTARPPKIESLEDVFRVDVDLPEGMEVALEDREDRLERRVATWTLNASVAVFAPPVGAAMLTYNMIKGENFRLTAQALTLTGAFMGLGLTKAMAATVAVLPF